MEELILATFEKSLISGAFIYLLYMFMTKFSKTLDKISNTMESMDKRMQALETRMGNIDGIKVDTEKALD